MANATTPVIQINEGNVGINTTTPTTKLHVHNTTNSQLTIERTGTAPGKYGFYTNTGNLFINNVTGSTSTIPMIILNNGNVGIGAGNPSSKLAIDGGFNYPTVRWFSSNNTTRYMQVGMITPTEHSIRAYGSSTELTFWTGSSFSMVINSSGNVGIGETNPGVKLQINTADENVALFKSSINDQLIYQQIEAFSSTTGTYSGAAAIELIGKANASGHGRHAWIGAEGTADGTYLTKIKFKVRGETATGYDWAGAAEAPTIMTLEGDGNVGIGTTSPVGKLNINTGLTGITYDMVDQANGSISFGNNSGGTAVPTITGKSNNNLGLMLVSGTNDTGPVADMYFDVRENDDTDYSTLTSSAYRFNRAGNPLMTILRSGNVGIGVTGPSAKLEVLGQDIEFYSGTGSQSLQLGRNASERLEMYVNDNMGKITAIQDADSNGPHNFILNRIFAGTGSNDFKIQKDGSTQLMVDTNGNVGIGTTTNTTIPLHVNRTGSGTIFKASGIAATIEIQSATAGPASLYMRPNITGDQSADFRMTANYTNFSGSWRWTNDTSSSSPTVFMKLQQSNGTLTVTGDLVAYGSPSDKKLKENIKPIESALDKVTKLQGVTFDWKENDSILDIKEDIGFIAQDVQKVVPELVRENKDGMLSMRHQGIAPILLEAIKELKAEIDLLKSKPCTCNKCNCNI